MLMSSHHICCSHEQVVPRQRRGINAVFQAAILTLEGYLWPDLQLEVVLSVARGGRGRLLGCWLKDSLTFMQASGSEAALWSCSTFRIQR